MGIVTQTAPDVLVPGIKKKPQKVSVTRVKEPSSLSMRTADILKMLSTASPATIGVSMRALQDVERSEQRADQGLDVLRRRAEAEADTEKQQAKRRGPPKILSRRDWVRSQPHFAHLKTAKRITKQEQKSTAAGYEAYLARVAAQAKLDLSYSKDWQQAQKTAAEIAFKRAQTGQADRANRPTSLEQLVTHRLKNQQPIRPQTRQMWTEEHSKEPGIEAQNERARFDRELKEKQYRDDFTYKKGLEMFKREAALKKEGLDRQSREGIERRKLEQKNQEKIAELMMALEEVIPRGTLGKPGKERRWLPDTAATPAMPASREDAETALHEIGSLLSGLRAYGVDETRIARLRQMYEKKILNARMVKQQVEPSGNNR